MLHNYFQLESALDGQNGNQAAVSIMYTCILI